MAEGGGAQNQGTGPQSEQPKELKNDAVDQKKLDRAAKERERRRKRRRRKAELKRLERETLAQQGAQGTPPLKVAQKLEPSDTDQVQAPEPVKPPQPSETGKVVPKEAPLRRKSPRRKKFVQSEYQKLEPAVKPAAGPEPAPEPPVDLQQELLKDRHIVQRSEEHAPRSKAIIPEAEPEKEELPKPKAQKEQQPEVLQEPPKKEPVSLEEEVVTSGEPSAEKPHPLTHKTHSFAGPLIGSQIGGQPAGGEGKKVEPQSQPAMEEVTEPEAHPAKEEPVPPQEDVTEPEPVQPSEPPAFPELPEQPQAISGPQAEPEQEVPIESMPPIFPDEEPPVETHHEPEQDVVIHDGHEEVRPLVGTGEVHEEPREPIEVRPAQVDPDVDKRGARDTWDEPFEEEKPLKKPPQTAERVKKVHEKAEATKEELPESEGLNERKSLLQAAGAFSAGVLGAMGKAIHAFRLKFDFRKILVFVFLVVLGGGLYAGYVFKVHEKVYTYVADFFKAPPPVEVNVDEELLREWGITTALLFGDNRGSTSDLFAAQLYDAYYFGHLSEPRVQGETGITPAYFYGKGQDLVAETNLFIEYINNLRELVSVYDVDVYQMLDQTTEREQALNNHIAKLKEIQDKSTKIVEEIKKEIDDLKVSYDSLTPDKSSTESDFFVALQGLAPEKSDFLLKSFIDVSQKQTALKARLSALQKLADYYDSSLKKLDIRITAIQKNFQALAQGIRVVDIPGANLDIIIKENP